MLKKNYKTICSIACAALVLILLVLQFLPGYWTHQKDKPNKEGVYETDSASLQEFMWVPSEHTILGDYFEDLFSKDFMLNDPVMMPVITLVAGVLCIVFTIFNREASWTALFPALVGGAGIYGYLCHPIFQMNGMWIVHLVVSVLIFGVAVASLVTSVILRIQAFRKELKDIASRT